MGVFYPLNTFFKEIPRVFATAIGSRNVANALKVAFTTLLDLQNLSSLPTRQ